MDNIQEIVKIRITRWKDVIASDLMQKRLLLHAEDSKNQDI